MELKNALRIFLKKENLLKDIHLKLREKEVTFIESELLSLKEQISEDLYNYIKPHYSERKLTFTLNGKCIEIEISNNIEGIIAQYPNTVIEQYEEINSLLEEEMKDIEFSFKYKDEYMPFTPLHKVLEKITYLEFSKEKNEVVMD